MWSVILEVIKKIHLYDWLVKLTNLSISIHIKRKEVINELALSFDNPETLGKEYIQPDCQAINPLDINDWESDYVDREPIFDNIEYFIKSTKYDRRHNQLFVLADAGMGKTSFLVMLKYLSIMKLKLFSTKYDYVIFKLNDDTLDKIKNIKNVTEKVLLLDALDEDKKAIEDFEERVCDILRETRPFKRVIITCRTQFFPLEKDILRNNGLIDIYDNRCKAVYLSPFSDSQAHEFLKKKFKILKNDATENDKNDKEKFEIKNEIEFIEKSKEILDKMNDLRMRPLLLSYIQEFLDTRNYNWNQYTVYDFLVRNWLQREVTRKLEGKGVKSKDLLEACIALAINLHKQERTEISTNELDELISKNPILSNISHINIKGRSLLNRNSKGDYRFSHYTIQEFLVSYSILERKINPLLNKIKVTDEIKKFVSEGERELAHSKFRRSNWRNIFPKNLLGISFENTLILDINFKGCDLSYKSFIETCFINTNLQRANLKGSDLKGANLKGTNLEEANLEEAYLEGTCLEGTNLKETNLRFANLEGTNLQRANFEGASLEGANLYGANLEGTSLKKADLRRALFKEANLEGANFDGAILTGANLANANLKGANFKGTTLISTTLEGANLEGANFEGTRIIDVIFNRTIYENINLEKLIMPKEEGLI